MHSNDSDRAVLADRCMATEKELQSSVPLPGAQHGMVLSRVEHVQEKHVRAVVLWHVSEGGGRVFWELFAFSFGDSWEANGPEEGQVCWGDSGTEG